MEMNLKVANKVRDDNCTRCRLGASAMGKDVCVTASGPGRAKYMVVTKLPLSSIKSAELKDYLSGVGIDSADVAFTAANKCRTWEVDPNRTDQKACKPFLDQEIEIIKPEWILALGNEALTALTGLSGIMKYRGEVYEHASGAKVVATVSPSAVTRNPGQRDGFVADLSLFNRLSRGEKVSDRLVPKRFVNVMTPAGLDALQSHLASSYGVYVDIETTGFLEWRPDQSVISIAVTTWQKDQPPEEVWSIPLFHPESPFKKNWLKVLRMIINWLMKDNIKQLAAHNGKFDLRWCRHFTGRELELTFDTLLAAHLLNENRPNGLKPLARALLGVAPWGIEVKNLLDTPLREVLKYNGLDTWYGALIKPILVKQLREQPRLARLMKHEMVPGSNTFTGIEMAGIWTDRAELVSRTKIAWEERAEIERRLMEHVPDKSKWPPGIKEANFNASNFLRWWLFEYLGFEVKERGKTKDNGDPGAPSVAEGLISQLHYESPHPVLKLLLDRVKWNKYCTSFLEPYNELIDDNDRIHSVFKMHGTVTGRTSSGKDDADKVTSAVQNRGVNLQQVPRDSFIRGLFGAAPGYAFLEFDYSQVELRIVAFMARERRMLELYKLDKDIHMATAMQMTGKSEENVTSEERKMAKPVNFGFVYGMSANKFISTAWEKYGMVVTEKQSIKFRKAFFMQFKDLQPWYGKQRAMAAKYGRVESPLGRVRHLPDITSKDRGVRSEAERQAINSPVQSFASDMAILALISLTREFKKRGLKARSVGTVHDAINFEVPLEELPEVLPLIKWHMENVPLEELFGVVLDVPILADGKIGRRWGGATGIEGNVIKDPKALKKWLKTEGYVPGGSMSK